MADEEYLDDDEIDDPKTRVSLFGRWLIHFLVRSADRRSAGSNVA
jgi:hypothetical protein